MILHNTTRHEKKRTVKQWGLRGLEFESQHSDQNSRSGSKNSPDLLFYFNYRVTVFPFPAFCAACSSEAAVAISCRAMPVESKMVTSESLVRPDAAPEMT